ncbi:MAG: MBL fold metallo-hydrolase [Ruminococcaceae bacterium]|nr:MBL fold metallo-hydrolase [Oscillospiraceae bacterium]
MKRIISLLLCVCMLASLTVCFASCGTKKLELDGYSVVIDSNVSATTADHFREAVDSMEKKTDCAFDTVKVKADDAIDGEAKNEILIGNTNRPETAKALGKLKGHGYVITVVKGKLVIAGTTTLLTTMALEYFIDEMLSDGSSTVEVAKTVVDEMEMVEFSKKWTFVYSNRLDGERDLINSKITDLKSKLSTVCGIHGSAMAMIPDTEKNPFPEVLIGLVDRDETRTFMSAMDVNSYGVGVQNGKLIATAFNDTMQAKAFTLLKDMLADSVCKADDGEETQVMLPATLSRIYSDNTNKSVVTDFPRPDGVALSGAIDVHNAMEYYYAGEGATAANYEAYCQKLTAAGYTLYQGREIEDSIFRIYNNESKNITLYVAFNAFKHAAQEEVTKYPVAIRIVAAPLAATRQLPTEMLSPQVFNKKQDASVTAVKISYAFPSAAEQENGAARIFGMIYIVTLEDGSFVVLDGGTSTTTDAKRIYDILKALYKEGHGGNNPTPNNPIRIAAWYLTHGHGDHYGSMVQFMKTYCADYNTNAITVDRLIANFASDEEHYNSEAGNSVTQYNRTVRDRMAEFSAYIKDAPGEQAGFEYIKVHTGQTFWLASTQFEVLYTHEDMYPEQLHVYNDSSTIIRMNFYHTVNGQVTASEPTSSMVWLGDAQTDASQWTRATYGPALKSDMVQVAHHGGNGCEWDLYELIDPTVVWWPHALSQYKVMVKKNGSTYQKVDYNISFSLPNAQCILLSDMCNYNMTITANGANYSPYDATANPKGVRNIAEATLVSTYQLNNSNKLGSMTSVNKAYILTLNYTAFD